MNTDTPIAVKSLAKISELLLTLNERDTNLLVTLVKCHKDKLVLMSKIKEIK
tara:strand:+ start:187 stop:342 length:156 start_codon:yes stop_codon:yes gene_type:complete